MSALCAAALLSLAHPLPAHRGVLLEPTTPHSKVVDPVGCLRDANVNQNMCGAAAGATCTGSHSPGKCCASTGWCGSSDAHCGAGMQAEYSHSRGLCPSAVLEIAQQQEEEKFDAKTSQCVSMQQIANAWVVATQGRSETDAQALCVPAVIVAAGFTYGVSEECPTKFALNVDTPGESGGKPLFLKGLWQVNESEYDAEPNVQAAAVYERFNASCSKDKCYQMADQCSDKLAVDVKDEQERFCSRWCCALLVASGRLGGASATNFRAHDRKQGAEDQPDGVPMVIIGSSGGCTSLAESPGDDWCTATCLDKMDSNPTCPTLCKCDGKHNEQAVDYDPIAEGNKQQQAAGVATAPVQAPAPTQVPAPDAKAATPPAAGAAVPMVVVGSDDSCRSLTDSASDEWCTGTCKGNMESNPSCPTLCECANASNKMEKVDVDPISEAVAAKDASARAAAAAAAAAPVPASSAVKTGEAGRDHLLIDGLGGIGDVEKACVQAMTGRGNPHAGHDPHAGLAR